MFVVVVVGAVARHASPSLTRLGARQGSRQPAGPIARMPATTGPRSSLCLGVLKRRPVAFALRSLASAPSRPKVVSPHRETADAPSNEGISLAELLVAVCRRPDHPSPHSTDLQREGRGGVVDRRIAVPRGGNGSATPRVDGRWNDPVIGARSCVAGSFPSDPRASRGGGALDGRLAPKVPGPEMRAADR